MASVDIEHGPLCPENRTSAMRGGSTACSVVRWTCRFVTVGTGRCRCYLVAGPPSFLSLFLVFWFLRTDEGVRLRWDPYDG
jgi:hypothetical protein